MVDCCKCENTATWKATDTIVALDTPFLCGDCIKTESVTGDGETNPCFERIGVEENVKQTIEVKA